MTGPRPGPPRPPHPLPGPAATPDGLFALRPVDPAADLPLLAGWMNDPEVDAFWSLAGPPERTAAHLRRETSAGHTAPCVALLDGTPVGYFEIYRADLDPLARSYPAHPGDLGIHLLLGPAGARGRGLGARLLDTLAAGLFDVRPTAGRIVAEPDIRNTRSVAAFERAGFRRVATLALPDKTAALMVRPRPAPPGPRTAPTAAAEPAGTAGAPGTARPNGDPA